jgi:hypothetical protein
MALYGLWHIGDPEQARGSAGRFCARFMLA